MNTYRILVSGSRRYTTAHRGYVVDALDTALDRIWREHPDVPVVLVHGAARGLDALADAWARSMPGVTPESWPADWNSCGPGCPDRVHRKTNGHGEYCPLAGERRNGAMVQSSPAELIAFPGPPGPSGTRNCMRLARAAGIPATEVAWPGVTSTFSGSAVLGVSAAPARRVRASEETR